MTKTYVVDTSAIISDPLCILNFLDSKVIIPLVVIQELDKLKTSIGERGRNARVALKLIDKYSENGELHNGIFIDDKGITLKVDTTIYEHNFGDNSYADNKILACASYNSTVEEKVILVTNDVNLRIRSRAANIDSMSYDNYNLSVSDLHSGCVTIKNERLAGELLNIGTLNPDDLSTHVYPHEFIRFQDDCGEDIVSARKVSQNKIIAVRKHKPWGIEAKNKEQAMALDLLMDNKIPLVTLIGKAGTGKSLIALASALELVVEKKNYNKLIIYRPIQSVGNDIGYLPGEMEEKLAPWFQAIMDNFEVLLSNKDLKSDREKKQWKEKLEYFKAKGQIEMEALTYIRGRSLPNCIILCDEVQNISKEDIKTLLTRSGEGTKIILTGDIEQIDNKDLDAMNNGLSYVIEKFKDSDLAGHITLVQGERSKLAAKAAELL